MRVCTPGIMALIVFCFLSAVTARGNEEKLVGQAIHHIEVIDESQFRLEVEKTELRFHPLVNDIDDGITEVEELIFHYTPLESFNPYLYDTEKVECPLVPDFASRPISRAPVAVFRTDFSDGADIIEWSLDITDYRGEIFRSISGKGPPNTELPWDGRGTHGEVLKPGFPYSFLFIIEDSGTNRYQYAGSTFSLPSLAYPEGRDLRVETAGFSLFDKKSAEPLAEAEQQVDRILREILDSPRRALQVEAWAESAGVAKARAAWLASTLEKRLLLSEGQIAHSGCAYKGNPPGRDGLLRVTLLKGGKVKADRRRG